MGRGPTDEYYKVLHEDYVRGTMTCLKPSTIRRVVTTSFPNILNIEPTNNCNLRCVYCPRQKAQKGVGNMSWDLFTKIIDEAAEHGKLIMLNFHKDGESFLHPQFIDMVRYAKKKDVAKTIHLNTNGLCWTDSVIDRILDCGIDDITVSLDAARPQTYKRHKGVDCLEKVERQVMRFFEKRLALGLTRPFVRVKIMEFEDITREEIAEFHARWTGVADMVQVTGIHSWSGEIDGIRVTDESSGVRYPCAIMWYALVVNWNGEVTVCSVDWNTQIRVGSAKEQTLHAIWNSLEIKEARRSQVDGRFDKYPVCRDCVVWVSVGDMRDWFAENKQFIS